MLYLRARQSCDHQLIQLASPQTTGLSGDVELILRIMLVALDSLDEHRNLIDSVEAIVETDQTLRKEVDVLLARHPQ